MSTTYGQIARKTPYSIEAEQSVLGCILISNTVAVELCGKLQDGDFYSPVHQTIFKAMKDLVIKNQSKIDRNRWHKLHNFAYKHSTNCCKL